MVLGQTITIVNQSGKVVKTSKNLANVWNEARSAYNEKKAELLAFRRGDQAGRSGERNARRQLEALSLADDLEARTSSRQERSHRPSPLRRETSDFGTAEPRIGELARRHTSDLEELHRHRPVLHSRNASYDGIDMDLAYGELPPPLPERKYDDEVALRSKMSGLQRLLDECNCLQHSATAIIQNLQKNPDNLAAVALTLGEISNLATKLAPGALMSMKGSFPAILALLASPEFAIAVGVGVGVTIIAFGGYKIIKKIQAKKDERRLIDGVSRVEPMLVANEPDSPSQVSEMDELREIDRIELWRRGITEAEAESVCTSVDGEFITPVATRTLIEEGRLTEAELKPKTTSGSRKHRKRSTGSAHGSRSSSSKNKSGSREKATKAPSGLRMLFKTHA
ncbi:hypothetical protein BAUCODRAFT_63157 [Baudoinia panamericana UAMH 10762]|uniref:Uncharacterized protein n=1 Tax=Baudoinia panamericana (strain UAMH 10762) TaxID=717646 RepID=M2LYF8_BAUPA|nr:uncharacterized protein BAUCODRAFT_63157 [Baudoinia panamericana UAMH 10762]EMC99747.1 hypothetical protein BAUCODRAFT_63157 [Baudoinia panamericana UAMH 10762]